MTPTPDSPHAVLGIEPGASDAEIRAAYLRKVRECPPDRRGDEFERVRDAYDALRDPRRRAARLLETEPIPPLVSFLDENPLRFVGPEPWLAALREEAGR